jgi:SAM-dependent methyltransferase
VINNGHKDSCKWIDPEHKFITVIEAGDNLGWAGGIMEGLKHTKAPYVMFLNDDTYIPTSDRLWLNQMVQHFRDPQVAAVGPSSNMVMGLQNMLARVDIDIFTVKFLIGFCVLMRRSAFDEVGGMDETLPGGDDFDWSIKLRDAGYKLIVDKNVFIFHYGCQTGNRIAGDYRVAGGWNSVEYTERVDLAIIKKHGFAKWWDLKQGASKPANIEYGFKKDSEGDLIREKVEAKGLKIADLGCGNLKTWKDSIGVDIVPQGDIVPQIGGENESQADVVADISQPLPFEEGSFDIVIARHSLEHMLDPLTAVLNWSRILKKGGKLVISLPDEQHLRTIPMNPEHYHAWTPDSFRVFIGAFTNLEILDLWDSQNQISFTAVIEKL